MGRKIRPYKRKKGSPKQKKQLDSFNSYTDELMIAYNTSVVKNDKKHNNT